MARYEKGENDRAISDFTKAIKMNPRYGMAHYYRAMAYLHEQQYDQAIADYTKAIEIDPQRFAVAYPERALIYFVKKEYDKAWEDVHKAESLGQEVREGFLKALREASGRKKWIKPPKKRNIRNRKILKNTDKFCKKQSLEFAFSTKLEKNLFLGSIRNFNINNIRIWRYLIRKHRLT